MDTNPVKSMQEEQMEMEIVVEERKEMEIEMVPEMYTDIISGEFAYDPVRLPVEQDPTQVLYNRKTLQTIWEIEQHARNPLTRQWFDIKSAIPQVELRKEMKHYIKVHRFRSNTVIANYSKILDEGEMKRHLKLLRNSVKRSLTTEKQWVKIWKIMNILRLFCEFHPQNIKTFISLRGFRCLKKIIGKTLKEKEDKEAALDVGKEIVRAIDVIIKGLSSRGENLVGILRKLGENSDGNVVIISLISILGHVYKNNDGYMKIQSSILRAFSTVFDEIAAEVNIVLGNTRRAVLVGYPCALNVLCQTDAIDISSEDLNHGISILGRARVSLLYFKRMYARALGNAVIICISREIDRPNQISGPQLLEAQMQSRHNSEALERGVRLIKDILVEEGQLAASILGQSLDIVKELVHMFERFTQTTENEEKDEVVDRKLPVLICEKSCEVVQCVHYRIAKDGLDISETISRKRGPLLDVEVLHKFINDRT